MAQIFQNNAETALALQYSGGSTLEVADSSEFPSLAGGGYFNITLVQEDAGGSEVAWEILKISYVSGNTFSVEARAQEGTTPRTWPVATRVSLRLTAAAVQRHEDHVTLSGNPHGTTAAQVGADPVGTATTAVAAHVAQPDPHSQYTTQAEAESAATAAVTAHVAQPDPHSQYTTQAEASAAAPVQSVAGKTGHVVLAKADVGLSQVDNTPDLSKPVSAITQSALDLKLNALNPASTGTMVHGGVINATSSTVGAGGWKVGFNLLAADYPMFRLGATGVGKYVSVGNGGDGSAVFFVNGTEGTVGTEAYRITPAGRHLFGPATDDNTALMQVGGGIRATATAIGAGGCKIGLTLLADDYPMLRLGATGVGKYSSICNLGDGSLSCLVNGTDGLVGTEAYCITPAGRHLFGPATDDSSTLMQVGGGARFTGNLGLGVTPPTMSGSSVAAQRAVFGSLSGGPYCQSHMAGNCYPTGSGDPAWAVWRYNTGATGDLGDATLYEQRSGQHYFNVAGAQGFAGTAINWNTAVTIDAASNLLVGVTSGSCHNIGKSVTADVGNLILRVLTPGTGVGAEFFSVSSGGAASVNTALKLYKDGITNRSINAGGTINASGADYAEYEKAKKAFIGNIIKGAIVGFDADGKLTLNFDDAFSFGVKSTDPCVVGGDVWGTEDQVGKRPEQPQFTAPEYAGSQAPADLPAKPAEPSLAIPAEPSKQEGETKAVFAARKAWWQQACQAAEAQHLQAKADYADALAAWEVQADEYAAALAQYQADQSVHQAAVKAAKAEFDKVTMPAYKKSLAKFEAALEAARQTVDRVAYSGKVPVNVWDSKPGDYIVAVRADDGGIAGVAVGEDEISFAQYRKAVGRVRRIEPDGRALIAVLVH